MLVLVVGGSGVGKDTLIRAAQRQLRRDPRFVFARRVVTRPAIVAVEDHASVSESDFAAAEAGGAFALSWRAHGLSYGIPATIRDDLRAGRVVVVNASRGVIAEAQRRFSDTRVILIDAALEVRARRLAGRGRESSDEIAERLSRELPVDLPDAVTIDNSGSLATAAAPFIAALRSYA